MSQYRITVLIGSLRKASFNRQLANGLIRLGPADFSFQTSRIDDLPLYNQDDDADQTEPVRRLKSEIRNCDGLLIVTPEYNRSMPGVLKNAIDHASRPHADSAFPGTPAGILGASIGAIGTAMAQQHLRNTLAYLDVPTLGQPEAFIQVTDGLFDDAGNIGPASREFLQRWMDTFASWVRTHTG